MKVIILFTYAIFVSLITLNGCSAKQDAIPSPAVQKQLTVFLVRHAEKVDHSKDANLSPEGKQRSEILAQTLTNAGIEFIHSSDFIRTRDTATPIAKKMGLEIELYNPGDLEALSQKLRKTGGRHLVVGHSGSTPSLVRILGGNPGSEINEEGEYDRLYIVNLASDDTVNSILLRYGKAYHSF